MKKAIEKMITKEKNDKNFFRDKFKKATEDKFPEMQKYYQASFLEAMRHIENLEKLLAMCK